MSDDREREAGARECMVCHGGGRGPGDDSVRCWACDGRGYLRPGVPSGHGLFIDWLFKREDALAQLRAERDTLTKAVATARAELRPRSNVRAALIILDAALASVPDEEQAK